MHHAFFHCNRKNFLPQKACKYSKRHLANRLVTKKCLLYREHCGQYNVVNSYRTAVPKQKLFGGCTYEQKYIYNRDTRQGRSECLRFWRHELHAYKTNDLISDEVFIVEKAGKAVVIESPCFFDNNAELAEYLKDVEVAGMLVAYHGAGATFLPEVPKYATQNAVQYSKNGGGKALIDNFTNAFGAIFDSSVHQITHIVEEGKVTIGGIDFVIKQTAEAFDIAIPEINAVYTHMLGHDCHSIVAGAAHADSIVAELKGYIAKGYDLILTSHYTPEDLKDAQTKIDYLENLKQIAANCADAQGFRAEVQKQYPAYSGQNYLDMTAGFFYA